AAALRREDAGRNTDGRANEQGDNGKFERGRIVLEHNARDRLAETERLTQIAANDTGEIMAVLLRKRNVQTKIMAKLLQILRTGAFPEHLLHWIAGNYVRQQKDQGDDQPKRGDGI